MSHFYSFTVFSGICCLLLATTAIGQTLPTDSLPRLNEPLRQTDLPTKSIPIVSANKITANNRAAIIADYTTNFLGAAVSNTELGWTGAVSGCVSGSISALAQSRTLQRINYYRRLVGVTDNTTFDPSRNVATQNAALMMKANNALDHFPPNTWVCYTAAGYTGAGNSNIASGSHSAQAIKQFIDDGGSNNTAVGHRRWLLYARQSSFGHGSTDNTDIIWVFNTTVTPASVPSFVAFPPAGYVPRDLIPARWSFSTPNNATSADFTSCTVTVTNEAGTALARTQYTPTNGYGDNTVVWDFTNPGTDLAWTGSTDKAFDVRVAGAKIGSVVQPDYVYRVVAIDPTTPTLTLTTVNPTCGPLLNNGSITANFDRGAKSYLWNNGATTQTVSNLGPGSYTVTVTDKNDNTYSQSATLSNTTANIPVVSASSATVCAGNVVSLTATNCVGTLTWSDGLGTGSIKSAMPAVTTNYTVSCTESGCVSSTAGVTVGVSGPKPALCSVSATNGTGNYFGVERFVLNTIDANSSTSFNDGANYVNRACDFSTTVTAGTNYTALVKGSYSNSHRCRIYIDYNNNGDFTDPGETVLTGSGNSVTATVPIPTTALQGIPLRVRVVADPSSTVSSCLLPGQASYGSGQAEDYALNIAPTTPVCTAMITTKTGNWSDPTVWSCNRVPTATDNVQVNHPITILTGSQANSRRVTFGSSGKFIYQTNTRLVANP
jgi:GEVED domain/Cysteine-rich secretory protein family